MDKTTYYVELINQLTKAERRLLAALCPQIDAVFSQEADEGDMEAQIAYLLKLGRESQLFTAIETVSAIASIFE